MAKLRLMFQPRSTLNSLPMANRLMPEDRIVITAKVIALRLRVFSSKRRRRYSGTLLAFEP